jgi:hypothetical protein
MRLDGAAVGIQAVFQEFLEHRSWPFDHFAGGDLADEQLGQGVDAGGLGGVGGGHRAEEAVKGGGRAGRSSGGGRDYTLG